MRLLLLGGNGQVGRELRRSLAPLGELVIATRNGANADIATDFDVPASLAAVIAQVAPDVVVNAAAYTAVDKAEGDIEAAFRANAEAPAVIAAACAKIDALLVHYSTDYVFDGTASEPYREDDATAPLGVYGTSKLAGEDAIRASGARHAILRTAWVYAAQGRNFLLTMLRLANERDELRVVADQVGAPTSAAWIADATAALIRHGIVEAGTWHLVASGHVSWHGFASTIMEDAHALGLLARMPTVVPITTAEFPTPARRPAYSVLDTTRLRNDFGIIPPGWREGLRATLRELVDAKAKMESD
ncbi:dTDP-4-dehydrorhamnose reductase [Thermomonas carbonis]|uniref:dTDP-4-dehydrorhamnose reductase n=1 Tax=Thermomonas carbonis TaxID=1463158 RepID=A0A7G9SQY8_9GAMM|nr:dTDP-4-dehydrorhamnose reductase [Thermomonas carbonis]QNN70263.1 dTDP-4-dehydrorhamnose reductase [Thermomonas carbonis]GHB98852.1 NAD(P)-dependent oxidoreductase [Thermomonas carbonis]